MSNERREYLMLSADADCKTCHGFGVCENVMGDPGALYKTVGAPKLCICVRSSKVPPPKHQVDNNDFIPLGYCEIGRVYRVEARNFKLAVFDGSMGFIGIRTKFGNTFLDSENHWVANEHATCRPCKKTEHRVPDDVKLSVNSDELFRFLAGLE